MPKHLKTTLLLLGSMSLGLILAIPIGALADKLENNEPIKLPLDEIRTFTSVLQHVKRNYVKEVDDTTLIENAVRGMLSGLDPHSSYLNKEEFEELQVGTSGEFGGLGIEVSTDDGFIKVVAPIDDTPAQRAGILSGDLITRIDDTPIKGMSLEKAVKLMRGKPGTIIILTIVRDGVDKPFKVSITRDKIRVKSVKSELLDGDYGYLRITQFQVHTTEHLLEAVDEFKENSATTLKGIVIDLRNNPGGVLSAAIGVSDAFLDDGLIVYTEGRADDSRKRYKAKPGDTIMGLPIVVLVNEGSASASEIVAGALQDHSRAIIMGSKTFGKGSVQSIQELNDGSAVKLTTARYFTPKGRSIQAEGIIPDIALKSFKIELLEEDNLKPINESNLSGHLNNASKKKQNKKSSDKSKKTDNLAKTDYQLYEALNLLKGLTILNFDKKD